MEKPERVLADIGRRIAELRHRQGWTQAHLAEQMDVSIRYVARLEAGVNVHVLTLCRVAQALKVRTAMLFEAPDRRIAREPGRPPRLHREPPAKSQRRK